MKPETGVLIGIGALSLFLVARGQPARAEDVSGGGGGGGGSIPGLGGLNLTMPDFSFSMPEYSYAMPEGETPTNLGDVNQQITDAMTAFLAGLGAGQGEQAGGLPELPGLPETPFSPAGESLASAWQNILGTGRNVAGAIEGGTKVLENVTNVFEEITTFPQKIVPTLQGWVTGSSRNPALLTAAGRAEATREFEQYSAEIAQKREELGLTTRVGDMWVSDEELAGWAAYALSQVEATKETP